MNSLKSTFVLFVRFALGRDSPSFTISSTPAICKFMFPLIVSIWLCFFAQDFHLVSKPYVSDFPTSLSSRIKFFEELSLLFEKLPVSLFFHQVSRTSLAFFVFLKISDPALKRSLVDSNLLRKLFFLSVDLGSVSGCK